MTYPDDGTLIASARAGDDRALTEVLQRYKGFARARARAFYLTGSDPDDVVQEAMIGLYKAVRDYDPSQDTPFRAFADLCICRQILTAVKGANRAKHGPLNHAVSLDARGRGEQAPEPLSEALEASLLTDPETLVLAAETIEELRTMMLRSLTALESEVLALHMQGRSYEEIAEVLGSPTKSIDNALQRVKRKVRAHLVAPSR